MAIVQKLVPNPKKQAIKDIKYLSSTMRGIVALADCLDEETDLQAAIDERQRQLAALDEQQRAASQRLAALDEEVHSRLADADAQARKLVAAGDDARANGVRYEEQAKRTLAEAEVEAERIVRAATDRARAAVADEVEAIRRKLAS